MTAHPSDDTFQPPRFGTDGLRGPAGVPPLDPETLRRVGAALGLHLQRSGPDRKRILVGNDGRESAFWILEALAQGLATADCATSDIGLCTTPALAWLTRHEPYVAGVMISASHNPAQDNGIKIFAGDGSKLSADAEREIEALTATIDFDDLPQARPREEHRLLDRYVEYLANRFGHLDLSGATLVLDAAHGGGAELAPMVLRGLGADVVEVGCEPDGFNINDGVGALHPHNLIDTVKASGAILGICLDGDGDRSIFVDNDGQVRDGDHLLATLGPWLRSAGRLPDDTVVATVMTNLGLRKQLAKDGIDVAITPVGDKNLAMCMREHGYSLGAEQSGHVLIAHDGQLIGDGLFTALSLLELPDVVTRGSAQAFRGFTPYPQRLENVPVQSKPDLSELTGLMAAQQRIEQELGDDGRVLLRYSGTENLCRVMVEAASQEDVDRCTEELAAIVVREIGA